MHAESIDEKTSRVLEKIKTSGLAKDFYLAGGTALALQIGHRQSIDLDWFNAAVFSVPKLNKDLSSLGKLEVVSEDEETLNALLDGIKISFFYYDYKQIFPLREFNGLKIADERDIAAMKLDATSSRGSKKDFIFCPEYPAVYRRDEWKQKINPAYGGINNRIPHCCGAVID